MRCCFISPPASVNRLHPVQQLWWHVWRRQRWERNKATKQLSCQFHQSYSASVFRVGSFYAHLKYLIFIWDSCVVDSSLAGDSTAKPLTVSLIFCPILSCRVSGMSLICFFTWHAFSSCIINLLAHGVQRDTFPECTLPSPAPCLHHCRIKVNYRACGAVISDGFKTKTRNAQ